jgi:hypothetical protein
MTTTMDEQNATLRAAVAERLANTPKDDHRMQGYVTDPLPERKGDEVLEQKGCASVDEFLTRVKHLSQCQATPQENYSEWTPPAYAAPVVVGQDVLNEWAEFTRDEPRQTGDGVLSERPTVAEQTLQSALEAVRDRHGKYGPPNEHFGRTASLVNAAFGTSFTAADWALVMVLDKVARLRGPTPTTDGGVDIAGYGGCYEECRSTLP